MFTVRVIPIARGLFKDYLTFFSRDTVPPGSIVTGVVRGRKVPSLVIETRDVREEKLDIRTAGFALKKLSAHTKPRRIFSSEFIKAAHDIAEWHGVHEGIAIGALTSHIILGATARIEEAENIEKKKPENNDALKAKADILVLQAERDERTGVYRNLAREAFARYASVLIMTPTVIEAERLAFELSRGIDEHVVLLTSELSKKKLIHEWNRAVTFTKPLLIIGTPLVLSIPRDDVDTIIIERESARAYRGRARPFLDFRRAAELISKRTGARLLYADFPLRVETRYLLDANQAEELSRLQVRPSGAIEVRVIDAKKNEETRKTKRVFSTITDPAQEAVQSELKKGGRVAVFASRRGLAPLTVCNDCGTPVTDPITGVPMILHKTTEGNVFLSHRSGAMLPSHTTCKTCNGWNLVTLGIGVDRVLEDVEKMFPESPVFLFTADAVKTHGAAKKKAREFFGTKGAIAVGTERMLPYLMEPVELAVVASIDSMLSAPIWRAHEHALSILFYLRERSENALIVQTRRPEHDVIKTFVSGNPADFYRSDISERERYGYPPFSVFVGLSWKGTRATVEKMRLVVQESFAHFDLVGPLPASALADAMWESRAVLRLSNGAWPNRALAERLTSLPPTIEVTIDPDEIV